MGQTNEEVECHIVGVVKSWERNQVCDMPEESERAQQGQGIEPPLLGSRQTLSQFTRCGIEMEDTNSGVIQSVKNCQGSRKIIHLLSERKV